MVKKCETSDEDPRESTVVSLISFADWEMCFLDDECVGEGHSLSMYAVVDKLQGVDFDEVRSTHLTLDDMETDHIGRMAGEVKENGPSRYFNE